MGLAKLPTKDSPALCVFVESSEEVQIEIGVPAPIVATRGGLGFSTGAAELAALGAVFFSTGAAGLLPADWLGGAALPAALAPAPVAASCEEIVGAGAVGLGEATSCVGLGAGEAEAARLV